MRTCLLAISALLLAACGGASPDAGTGAGRPATGAAIARPASTDDAVAAVLESPGTPVAQLRFLIDSRPVAGKPFRLQLIASAGEAVSPLSLGLESADLAVDPANASLALRETGSGAVHQYSASRDFMVSAQHAGLVELTVHLTGDTAEPETLYVIPVLVAGAASPG